MAEIRPFGALRYTAKAGPIAEVVCPPYDIISEQERLGYLDRNQYNVIRLELPKGEHPYQEAGETLEAWLSEGILACDERAAFYIYEEEFSVYGTPHRIKGLVCLVRLEPFENKVVLPHEQTLAKAKQDRLNLMNATACNFSSVYSLYRDQQKVIAPKIEVLSSGVPDQEFMTDDGITHRIWVITDIDDTAEISTMFQEEQLYIADGHHRYTTMLNYRDQLGVQAGTDHPANFGMMTLMCMDHPGLVIFPTHRLVRDLSAFHVESFLAGCREYFSVRPCDAALIEQELAALAATGQTVFGLYAEQKAWILQRKDSDVMRELLPEMSAAYQNLDVAILHTLLLERLLGIDRENLANQVNLTYVRDAKDCMQQVDQGAGNCAFLINATKVEEIAAVADAAETMPQKSTYFYPKLITGHLMYRM